MDICFHLRSRISGSSCNSMYNILSPSSSFWPNINYYSFFRPQKCNFLTSESLFLHSLLSWVFQLHVSHNLLHLFIYCLILVIIFMCIIILYMSISPTRWYIRWLFSSSLHPQSSCKGTVVAFEMGPNDSTSWCSCSYVMPFPWVWVWLGDLFLTNRIR